MRPGLSAALAAALITSVAAADVAPPRLGFVATRGQYPGYAPTQLGPIRQIVSRIDHRARDDMDQARLIYVNYWGSAEAATGADLAVSVSIEYPAGTFTRVTCGGQRVCVIPDGGEATTDPLPTRIPSGELFREWVWAAGPAGIPTFPTSRSVDRGRWSVQGEPSLDLTQAGGALDPTDWAYGATAIVGPTSRPSVLIVGDSRAEFTYALPGSNDGGNLAPGIAPTCAYTNLAVGGSTIFQTLASSTKRRRLTQYATRIAIALGVNDLHNRATDADQAIRTLDQLAASYAGRPVFVSTIEPVTTGLWSAPDGSDQVADPVLAGKIDRFNAAIRARRLPHVAGFNDLNLLARQPDHPQKWRAPGYTVDGLHGAIPWGQMSAQAINPDLVAP